MTHPQKIAVVLFNLGGPDCLGAVRPFLQNLFKDPAIINLPCFLRHPLAWFIAKRRHEEARSIYKALGGSSPLLANTQAQALALEGILQRTLPQAKVFVAMRYWHPFVEQTMAQVKAMNPDHIVLLPLYPHMSTTTTLSSFSSWDKTAKKTKLKIPTTRVCCYPTHPGFTTPFATAISQSIKPYHPDDFRVLFSAHGLPQKVVDKGDPYAQQILLSAQAIAGQAALLPHQWRICYQSRVGPLKWLEPTTQSQIHQAAAEGKGIIMVPISFVSEHSETLYELDQEYGALAAQLGVPFYHRISTAQTHPLFIDGLAQMVEQSLTLTSTCSPGADSCCPQTCHVCPCKKERI